MGFSFGNLFKGMLDSSTGFGMAKSTYDGVNSTWDSGGGGGGEFGGYGSAGAKYLKYLKAYQAGLPRQLAMDKEFQPQFTAQQLQDFQNALFGQNGKPGYLDLYKNSIVPAMSQMEATANRSTRTANINDLTTLGPGALTALQGANPQQAQLMDQLTKSASSQLQLGTVLDPNQIDQINSMVLGNWANRGLGNSNPAQLDQALQYFAGGQDLLNSRTANAGAVAGMQNEFYTDPIMQMLMGGTDASRTSQQLTDTSAGFGFGGSTMLPMDQATSMLGGASTVAGNAGIAAGNNSAGLMAGGIGAAGAIGGAAILAF